jgi:lipopolysaccharide transport system permease protein
MLEAERRRGPAIARLLEPSGYAQAFGELISLLAKRRSLTLTMARRELVTEHGGKALGPLWGVIQPLFLLAVYAFIYGVVFKSKIGGTVALPRNFTVYLLAGLVPWFAFQQCLTKSVGAVTGNANLVKQVQFDLNVLPVASALVSCVWLAAGLAFLALFTAIEYGTVPWTYALTPVVVIVEFVGMVGFAFFLSAIGAFVRDVRDLVQLSAVLLIFVMPIVYLPGSIPAAFNPLLWVNPFTYLVYCYQDIFYFGRIAHPWSWLAFPLWSLFCFVAGYRLFRRLRPYFANVL